MQSRTVREVMTANPVALGGDTALVAAARSMRDRDVGVIIVLRSDGDTVCGVVTDRDIAMRAVADGWDPRRTRLDDVCSHDLVTLRPDDPVERAVELMRQHAVRRLPVVDDSNHPLGIISLGDLAVERDPGSALGEISAAEPNR
jgi:CBS domain-containing protein